MSQDRIVALTPVVLIFLAVLWAGAASASTSFVGDKVISPNTAYAITIVMPTTGGLEFTIDVYSGPNIDIVLVDGENYQKFVQDGLYTYYEGGTFSDSNHAIGAVWLDSGTYYLIFRNDGISSVTVHYSYTPTSISSGGVGDSFIDLGWIVIGGIIVITLIVVISLLLAARKK